LINVSLGTINVSLNTSNIHSIILCPWVVHFHPNSLEKVVNFLVNCKGKNYLKRKQPRENNKVELKVGTYMY
jgi:hypothetical protein